MTDRTWTSRYGDSEVLTWTLHQLKFSIRGKLISSQYGDYYKGGLENQKSPGHPSCRNCWTVSGFYHCYESAPSIFSLLVAPDIFQRKNSEFSKVVPPSYILVIDGALGTDHSLGRVEIQAESPRKHWALMGDGRKRGPWRRLRKNGCGGGGKPRKRGDGEVK